MSNKVESLLKGVGNVEEVFDACCRDAECNPADFAGMLQAANVLSAAIEGSDPTRKVALATLAAILNRDLQRNGSLYFVGERGTIERETVIQSGVREAIAGLIS